MTIQLYFFSPAQKPSIKNAAEETLEKNEKEKKVYIKENMKYFI